MSNNFLRDLPNQPRTLRELVLVPTDEGLIIDGGSRLRILCGRDVTEVLPTLFPLMSGDKTIRQLSALSGIDVSTLSSIIALLAQNGLVEEGENESSEGSSETLQFLRRFRTATGINASGQEAYTKLQSAGVILVAPEDFLSQGYALSAVLKDVELGCVHVCNVASLAGLCPDELPNMPSLVTWLSYKHEDEGSCRQIDSWCSKWSLPWLRACEADDYLDLGPCFYPGESPCYICFRALHGKADTFPKERPLSRSYVEDLFIGLVATEIVYVITGIAPSLTLNGLRRFDLKTWRTLDLRCCRIPGCASCRPDTKSAESRLPEALVETALIFEDYISLPSRRLIYPTLSRERGELGRLLGANLKRFPACERYELPGESDLNGRGEICSSALSLATLATALRLSVGIRDQNGNKTHRWAASAGNLGSVEAFVLALSVDDLRSGIYFYEAKTHSLARLERRHGNLSPSDLAIHGLCGTNSLPDAFLIFTGAFGRVRQKYGPFAYRLIYLDAGATLSQLEMIAESLGIDLRIYPHWWDDIMSDHLGLEEINEHVTILTGLSSPSATPALEIPAKRNRNDPQEMRQSLNAIRTYHEMSVSRIVDRLYYESRRVRSLQEGDDRPLTWSEGFSRPQSLGLDRDAPRFDFDIHRILKVRSTHRRFAPKKISAVPLVDAIFHSYQRDKYNWPEALSPDGELQFLVLALDVEGLRPGVWAYDSFLRKLVLTKPGLPREVLEDLFVQDEFTSAPAHIWIVSNLAAACAAKGAWAHRMLLLRAGAAAHHLWFRAMNAGLVGAITAGLVPGAARKHLGLDGYVRSLLIGVAVGFEA